MIPEQSFHSAASDHEDRYGSDDDGGLTASSASEAEAHVVSDPRVKPSEVANRGTLDEANEAIRMLQGALGDPWATKGHLAARRSLCLVHCLLKKHGETKACQ